jgi:hypothetical protein
MTATALPELYSRSQLYALRCSIRYRLTDDEAGFVRAGIVGSHPEGTALSESELDDLVRAFTDRMTVAQYRALRDGVREFQATIQAAPLLARMYPAGTTMGDILPTLPGVRDGLRLAEVDALERTRAQAIEG